MNKISHPNDDIIVDISDYSIQREKLIWKIPELGGAEKDTRIAVRVSEKVFWLIVLGEGEYIPWFPARGVNDSQDSQ